jgi:hypothetical protein
LKRNKIIKSKLIISLFIVLILVLSSSISTFVTGGTGTDSDVVYAKSSDSDSSGSSDGGDDNNKKDKKSSKDSSAGSDGSSSPSSDSSSAADNAAVGGEQNQGQTPTASPEQQQQEALQGTLTLAPPKRLCPEGQSFDTSTHQCLSNPPPTEPTPEATTPTPTQPPPTSNNNNNPSASAGTTSRGSNAGIIIVGGSQTPQKNINPLTGPALIKEGPLTTAINPAVKSDTLNPAPLKSTGFTDPLPDGSCPPGYNLDNTRHKCVHTTTTTQTNPEAATGASSRGSNAGIIIVGGSNSKSLQKNNNNNPLTGSALVKEGPLQSSNKLSTSLTSDTLTPAPPKSTGFTDPLPDGGCPPGYHLDNALHKCVPKSTTAQTLFKGPGSMPGGSVPLGNPALVPGPNEEGAGQKEECFTVPSNVCNFPYPISQDEICRNGKDDDNDGKVDEAYPCSEVPGESKPRPSDGTLTPIPAQGPSPFGPPQK